MRFPSTDDLESALLSQARLDRRDASLGFAERNGARVHGVVTEDEVVIVRDGRADNKLRVGSSLEFDWVVRGLEGRQVAFPKLVGDRHGARAQRRPRGPCVLRVAGSASALLPSIAPRGS